MTLKQNSKKYERILDLNSVEMFSSMKKQMIPYLIKQNEQNLDINIPDYLNERADLLNYLEKLIEKGNFIDNDRTFFLSAMYLDIVMMKLSHLSPWPGYMVNKSEIQPDLIVIACFLLALKFIENDMCLPAMSEFQGSVHPYYYSIVEVKKYEVMCLKLLDYKLNYSTVYDFLELLLFNGIWLTFDQRDSIDRVDLDGLNGNVCNIVKNFISDPGVVLYSPDIIACAIVAFARELMKLTDQWPRLFEQAYKVSKLNIQKPFNTIKNQFFSKKKSTTCQNNSLVHKKSGIFHLGVQKCSYDEDDNSCERNPFKSKIISKVRTKRENEKRARTESFLYEKVQEFTDERRKVIQDPNELYHKFESQNISSNFLKRGSFVVTSTSIPGKSEEKNVSSNCSTKCPSKQSSEYHQESTQNNNHIESFVHNENSNGSKKLLVEEIGEEKETLHGSTKESILKKFNNSKKFSNIDIDLSIISRINNGGNFKRFSSVSLTGKSKSILNNK